MGAVQYSRPTKTGRPVQRNRLYLMVCFVLRVGFCPASVVEAANLRRADSLGTTPVSAMHQGAIWAFRSFLEFQPSQNQNLISAQNRSSIQSADSLLIGTVS